MELWSNIFLSDPYSADYATCSVPLIAWRRITEGNPGPRLFGRITYEGRTIYVALGSPNNDIEGTSEKIYLPTWLLDKLGILGEGERCDVEWLSQNAFPEATRIVLRPHDSAFYHSDAKEELERSLTRLGVLCQGDTLNIPLECLGGYDISIDIVVTEPANIVLAEGDEVVVEFEEALDAPPRPDTPIPPDTFQPIEPGARLGGDETRIMPSGRRWNPWRDGPWSKDLTETKKE
jgi:Ubiquitin fusion degradation protein UFD1